MGPAIANACHGTPTSKSILRPLRNARPYVACGATQSAELSIRLHYPLPLPPVKCGNSATLAALLPKPSVGVLGRSGFRHDGRGKAAPHAACAQDSGPAPHLPRLSAVIPHGDRPFRIASGRPSGGCTCGGGERRAPPVARCLFRNGKVGEASLGVWRDWGRCAPPSSDFK